ncbi:MAG: lysophospholipid acyltransferase family protein [Paracoccaceae bacterium]
MRYALQWARSLLFNTQMYLAMAVMGVGVLPFAVIDRRYAFAGVRTYARYIRWSARVLIELRSEIRGQVPDGEVLIASKHQSFLDIILILSVLPRPKFIMKKELRWAPFVGYYAKRIGCVAVDRGKRGVAIRQMLADVESGAALPGQLIIFPQGTRVAAGKRAPYKAGVGVLYQQLGQPCIPVATNVGVFWRRRGIYRAPGLAVVEFLPPVAPGMRLSDFMTMLEDRIETASDALMAEAGLALPKEP